MQNDKRETPSSIPVPEQAAIKKEVKEAGAEVEHTPKSVEADKAPAKEATPVQSAPVALPTAPVAPVKDAYHQRIERVLEDDLVDIYLKIPAEKRQQFKIEGERVATQLRQMIDSTKVKIQDVMKLITNWLKMIPGVSSLFLEQEAKIKADKVVQIAEEKRKEKEGL